MKITHLRQMVFVTAMVLATGMAQAVTIDMVPIGDINNAADSTGFGSVDHAYNIGKYEVTAGQYCEFLNAKAKTDLYELYNPYMESDLGSGCRILRTGESGSYAYNVAADWANRPVNYVCFWDAARFTNWLCNGQGDGDTETGAYTLNGYNDTDGRTIVKNVGAQWWIPSENEWYKAAYYKGSSTNAGYWPLPTSSDIAPGRDMTDISGNNANYYISMSNFPIDSGKRTTVVGEFQNSASPYGTFDQGGNIQEWNDTVWIDSVRGVRGGAFNFGLEQLGSSYRGGMTPTNHTEGDVGFRVASSVPEPGSLLMTTIIALGGLLCYCRKRQCHR